jgi:glycosyltransferase involved in cell wall biosynthesis
LRLVLAGLEIQTADGFEIIIADDGSSPEVVDQLKTIINESQLAIKHIWQEDKGFRKNKILNQAILKAESDYIIFIDGDCIPHSEFVREQITNRQKQTALTGRRVNLSERITSKLTPAKVRDGYLEKNFYSVIWDGLFGKSYDVEKGFYVKSKIVREFINRKKRGLLGCNMSMNKSDLIAVNGFDERYEAPSIGEDSDLQYRLELNGVHIKSLNNIAVQYHLHHKLLPRKEENLKLFEEVKSNGSSFTKHGIKK